MRSNSGGSISPEFNFAATSFSIPFHPIQCVKSVLVTDASYQVLPSIPETFPGDVWDLVMEVLPLTMYLWGSFRHCVVDLCLPFGHQGRSYLSRFFMANRKVIGVRVRTGVGWSRYRCEKFRLPEKLLDFYKKDASNCPPDGDLQLSSSCPLGEFYISFRGFRIAPIFSSEL
jgi:hypothetical protein